MKFEKIIIPPGWQDSFTKYPNGRTIFEALTSTITSVNEGIEAVNTKVDQGLLAIDAAANTIRSEVTASFLILQNKLEQDIEYLQDDLVADISVLQSQLAAVDAQLADKVTQSQLAAVDAQLAEKAPQSTTYTKTEVDELKADKLKATNLVVNGDFSQGTKGWSSVDLVVDGIAEKTVTSLYADISQSIANPLSYAKRKIYASALLKTTSPWVRLAVSDGITNTDVVSLGDNQFQRYSLVKTMASNMTAFYIKIHDLRASGWDKFYADKFKIIDLTATFGAGNEPTKEQMDRLLSEFPNSWFDGTQEILPLKVVSQLLDEKANKAQETWIPLTLLNGATVGSGLTVSCYKDTLGIVRFKGRVVVTTPSVVQVSIPVGYRNNTTQYFTIPRVDSATVVNRADVSNDVITIYATGTYDLSGISYRAGA